MNLFPPSPAASPFRSSWASPGWPFMLRLSHSASLSLLFCLSLLPCLLCSVRSAVCDLKASDTPEWRMTEQACSKISRNRSNCSTTLLQNNFVRGWPCRRGRSVVWCPGLLSQICIPHNCKSHWFRTCRPMCV